MPQNYYYYWTFCYNVIVRDDHSDYLKKYVFNYPDKRNFHVIRYFTHTTRGTCNRLYPICDCGEWNTPYHGANECRNKLKDRKKIFREINNIFGRHEEKLYKNLYDYLSAIFFSITKIAGKDRTRLFEILRDTIYRLIVSDKSECNPRLSMIEESDEAEVQEDNYIVHSDEYETESD